MKKKFILCGTLGWCMEILFTGLHSFFSKDYTLAGRTSIWMFPIYGMACIFSPLSQKLKTKNTLLRGSIYTAFIFVRGIFIRSVFKVNTGSVPGITVVQNSISKGSSVLIMRRFGLPPACSLKKFLKKF